MQQLQELNKLAKLPEWAALRSRCEFLKNRQFARLARLFEREGYEPDYDRLQYMRGVFAGMKLLLDTPGIAEKKLRKILEEGLELEPDDEEGDDA